MPSQPIPVEDRFWTKVTKSDACWLWNGARDEHGYGLINIDGRNRRTHRIAYILTYGAIPDGLVVRHSCDTPACVNPDHLILGTQLDNIDDRNTRGRTAKGERAGYKTHPDRYPDRKGERNGRAKLTQTQVEEIRERYATGDIGARPLAAMYGVSRALIRLIVQGKAWVDCPQAKEWSKK